MSHFWNCNPELYTEIIFDEMVLLGLCNEDDDPEKTVQNFINDPKFIEIAIRAEAKYWENIGNEETIRQS